MQSLQGQLVCTHILMDSLKLFSDFSSLNSSGPISYILGSRYEILSVHWKTLFTWGVIKSGWLRKLYWFFVLSIKISPVISGNNLCFTLNIAIVNAWIFSWCKRLSYLFLRDLHKMTFCYYRLVVNIVRVDVWSYYCFCDCEASKLGGSSQTVHQKMSS